MSPAFPMAIVKAPVHPWSPLTHRLAFSAKPWTGSRLPTGQSRGTVLRRPHLLRRQQVSRYNGAFCRHEASPPSWSRGAKRPL